MYLRCFSPVLESRLDAEEAALETLKTESSGIAYISLATVYISTWVQSVAIAYISTWVQSGYGLIFLQCWRVD